MNRVNQLLAAFPILLVVPVSLNAGEWDLTGFAGLTSRTFGNEARFEEQHTGSNGSVVAQSEFYWRGTGNRLRFGAVAFGRLDLEDDERSHADLREANLSLAGETWDLNVGIDKVFWGVTESRHLVDVINQSDVVEDIDEEDKLGQPMVNLNLQRDFGRFELYVLPRFRERTFPGANGRLRPALPVDGDAAVFEARDGKRHRDVSLRYSHFVGDFDIGAYIFDGTSREPWFQVADDGLRLVPVYEQMRQFGVDVQLTRGSWLGKLEAISRETSGETFSAAVGGVEYTFFGARGSAADVGILFEYLYDGRSDLAPPTPFDSDVFLGARLALNDASDTSALAGVVFDVDTHDTFLNVEAERRFGDNLTLDVRLRLFRTRHGQDPLSFLGRDDYLQLTLSWYY